MKFRYLLSIASAIVAAQLQAAEPTYGPVIEGYGPVFVISDRDVPLRADRVYKVLFDAAAHPGGDETLNVALESVARFINMHGANGVSVDNMNISVVLHGSALKSVLSDAAYRERFAMANPNSELVKLLAAAGVRFYVCGQSMGFRGFDKGELADNVELALSAMTMLADLQADGYSLLP